MRKIKSETMSKSFFGILLKSAVVPEAGRKS